MVLRAPAKLNLCLYLGPRREDGLHELVSLFCPLLLSDRIVVSDADGDADVVVCPGVEGPNLAAVALEALRARGWRREPVAVEIDKRIPIAAGLGGGSANAAAVLRLAGAAMPPDERQERQRSEEGGVPVAALAEVAAALGSDVPSQVEPAFALVSGVGERVERRPDPAEFAAVLIPSEPGLGTARVYAEADRLGLGRPREELEELASRLRGATASGGSPLDYPELLVNDLERAAVSLRPEIAEARAALEEAGAARVLVAGSGPTACGLFEDVARADIAAGALPPRFADAIVTAPQRLV